MWFKSKLDKSIDEKLSFLVNGFVSILGKINRLEIELIKLNRVVSKIDRDASSDWADDNRRTQYLRQPDCYEVKSEWFQDSGEISTKLK